MAKGTIAVIHKHGQSGHIEPEGGGERVYFRVQWVKNAPPGGLTEGMAVEFESKPGQAGKGPQTAWVKYAGKGETQGLESGAAGRTGSTKDGYRFFNPYNFVRPLNRGQAVPDNPDTQLMLRCTPPPHDRWVGLTGRVACRLTAATPLFVSDSDYAYQPADKKDKHHTYQFFKYDFGAGEEAALPASSLRGMVRSVFEAATNSCMAHFDYGARLSYHLEASEALKLTPARVEKTEDGRWQLRLLPGNAQLKIGNRPDELYAGRVERYDPLQRRPPRRRPGQPAPKPRPFQEVPLNGLKHGDKCYALARRLKFPPVWNVIKLSKDRAGLQARSSEEKILEGYLCLNNQNIENKRFERFFFYDHQPPEQAQVIPLNEEVRSRYADLIRDYQLRHAKDVEKLGKKQASIVDHEAKRAAFSRFIVQGPQKARDGDLVYAMLSGSPRNPTIHYIVPVAIPRVGYDRKVYELLLDHLHKCDHVDHLCPACRTFGWTYGRPGDTSDGPQRDAITAYAGRVRFGHGRLTKAVQPMPPVSLSILSSPKPTTFRFYLMNKREGRPKPGQYDAAAGYDNRDNILRGRKVYRHQGHDRHYWHTENGEHRHVGKNSDQNRTAYDPLPPETQFTFTVDFENLASAELGALLWSLQLEDDLYHRLGFGKPLGFGSVQIAVESVELLEPAARYQIEASANTLSSGWSEMPADVWQQLITRFQEALSQTHNSDSFNRLPNIRDLQTLLSKPKIDLPIHYPRPTQERDKEGKNYEWFMGNNRNRDLRLVLPLPEEDEGLPLIDKTGQKIS
jgi:CRISPR-associated protein (TIGR03986 family)